MNYDEIIFTLRVIPSRCGSLAMLVMASLCDAWLFKKYKEDKKYMSFLEMEIDSGGDYIKLTAGSVVTFHILSQTPDKKVIHWVQKKKILCEGKICELCANGDKPKQRWTCDVWDRKDLKIKKLEFGSMIAGQLKSIAEMLGENQQTIHQVDIRIKTTGSGLETDYSVLHVPMSGTLPSEVEEKYAIPF